MLFSYAFKYDSQEKIFKNIFKIDEPFAMHNHPDLLRVRQKIILEINKLGNSFIRKNSSMSSRTISRLKKRREEIFTSPPKKGCPKRTPQAVINKFVDYLDENSEPADSRTPPVIISKKVKSPVRYLTKPVDALINDYEPFQKRIKQVECSEIQKQVTHKFAKSNYFQFKE